ncbi:MAG: glutathione-dependent formaldehyde dehydrogenase [Actinomycetota bacterium]|nr:glutathione-dependent formaldehyde dehydrogenase [Actinomycetota bacterium]
MKAVVWHGTEDVRVDDVPDPTIQEPTDAIVRITSTAICGSDLHLYRVLTMYMEEGDILGHEPMGIVEEVGSEVTHIKPGDRVVIPFNIACGQCFMCEHDLQSQCETTQVRDQNKGAALFGFSKLYGQVPGGQAEFLRVPQAQYGPIKVPEGSPDERFLFLSDVIPTAWQAVRYADTPQGGTLAVYGLGPIGQFSVRVAKQLGVERVIGVDLVPERLELARRYGAETVEWTNDGDPALEIMDLTDGRGADSVIDAVGTEAHGAPIQELVQKMASRTPSVIATKLMEKVGSDRTSALHMAISTVRRGGTLSLIGVYGGSATPMPMMELFDKQVQVRMGQANVKAWIDEIMPLVTDDADPLGTEDFATHKLPLDEAPGAYEMFQKKEDGAIKVVLTP